MKKLIIILLIPVILASCSKEKVVPPMPVNITVKAIVWNTAPTPGAHLVWQPGLIFSKPVAATGTAVVTWYFAAGWIVGNPTNRFSTTLNFSTSTANGSYFKFTQWPVLYDMIADSVRIKDFKINCDCSVVKLN